MACSFTEQTFYSDSFHFDSHMLPHTSNLEQFQNYCLQQEYSSTSGQILSVRFKRWIYYPFVFLLFDSRIFCYVYDVFTGQCMRVERKLVANLFSSMQQLATIAFQYEPTVLYLEASDWQNTSLYFALCVCIRACCPSKFLLAIFSQHHLKKIIQFIDPTVGKFFSALNPALVINEQRAAAKRPGSNWVQCLAQEHFVVQLRGERGSNRVPCGSRTTSLIPMSYSRHK